MQNCNYSIVHDVAMSMDMHIVNPEDSWDLWWCNTPMDIKKAKCLKKYQVIYKKIDSIIIISYNMKEVKRFFFILDIIFLFVNMPFLIQILS